MVSRILQTYTYSFSIQTYTYSFPFSTHGPTSIGLPQTTKRNVNHNDHAQQRTAAHCHHQQKPLLSLSSFHYFGSLAGCHDHHNQSKLHTRSEVTPQATFTSSSPTPTSQKQNKDTNVTFTFLLPIPLTEFPFIGSVFHPPRPHYHLTLPYSRFPFTFICR